PLKATSSTPCTTKNRANAPLGIHPFRCPLRMSRSIATSLPTTRDSCTLSNVVMAVRDGIVASRPQGLLLRRIFASQEAALRPRKERPPPGHPGRPDPPPAPRQRGPAWPSVVHHLPVPDHATLHGTQDLAA